MPIPDIGINPIGGSRLDGIPDVQIWRTIPSNSVPAEPPISLQIGVPIIDIPGCIEAHPDNKKSKSLATDDQRGVMVFCDAGMPSFNPIDYTPEDLVFTSPAQVPKISGDEKTEEAAGETPPPAAMPAIILPCPLPDARPIGSMNASRTKRVIAYEMKDGKCITLYEAMPVGEIINEQLPDIPIVITTATIAAVGVVSALLAKPLGDILLKAIKPTVKKVIKKIAAIRGKATPSSPQQRRAEQRALKK